MPGRWSSALAAVGAGSSCEGKSRMSRGLVPAPLAPGVWGDVLPVCPAWFKPSRRVSRCGWGLALPGVPGGGGMAWKGEGIGQFCCALPSPRFGAVGVEKAEEQQFHNQLRSDAGGAAAIKFHFRLERKLFPTFLKSEQEWGAASLQFYPIPCSRLQRGEALVLFSGPGGLEWAPLGAGGGLELWLDADSPWLSLKDLGVSTCCCPVPAPARAHAKPPCLFCLKAKYPPEGRGEGCPLCLNCT